jgi:hypothetical protein
VYQKLSGLLLLPSEVLSSGYVLQLSQVPKSTICDTQQMLEHCCLIISESAMLRDDKFCESCLLSTYLLVHMAILFIV